MAFRRQPSNPNPYPFANQPGHQSPPTPQADDSPAQQNNAQSRKRPRAPSDVGDAAVPDPFHHENGSDVSEGSDDVGKPDKKAGRRKIKIEFIQDKSRRHITFSKRKAGIMKKAYELSTLTGTQVLLLVVSETGLVYTFTTAKLQPLVTQPEGKNLIQACLNAPHSALPSSLPVGSPIGRSSSSSSGGGVGMGSGPTGPGRNVPGGLAIAGDKDSDPDHQSNPPDHPAADSDHPAARSDDPDPARPQRRPSNAPPPKDSPPQPHRKPASSPSLLPLQYPGAYGGQGMGLGVGALDPGMYGHHPQPSAHPQYLPQQGAQPPSAGAPPYMGAPPQGQWQPGQASYARR